jgi:hypothetical protein
MRQENSTLLNKYRRSGRRRENFDMLKCKPPYHGATARRFGWPCVPPYQMKRRKKQIWRSQWFSADQGIKAEARARGEL